MIKKNSRFVAFSGCLALLAVLYSCANLGYPDGGAYDETPPVLLGSIPMQGAVNSKTKKIVLQFDEFIKLENASEKVVVSPPQFQKPEVKANGKKVVVELADSLLPDRTYSIDFADAIVDNNEGNPLGHFSFTFSTSNVIDTMQVGGYLLNAADLEPIKGVLVGLYSNLADSAFTTQPFLRVARTDSRGYFSIKGVANGAYRVYALDDMNQNFLFDQKSERIAFSDSIIRPSLTERVRMDTVWVDSLTIDTIIPRKYTAFLPDDILLQAFQEKQTLQYLTKSERNRKECFSLFFATENDSLPKWRGLNFDATDAFLMEKNEKMDTLQYWLKDSLVYNLDTLKVELDYWKTDTLGELHPQRDTLELSYKHKKNVQSKKEKEKEKTTFLYCKYDIPTTQDVYRDLVFDFAEPLAEIDHQRIHLEQQVDTLWEETAFTFKRDELQVRRYRLQAKWNPGETYRLRVDSTAFHSYYGLFTNKIEEKFKVHSLDDYASLFFNIKGTHGPVVVELLDSGGKVIRSVQMKNGQADFYYLAPGTYYARLYEDRNANNKWDTGLYEAHQQAEQMYYYPLKIQLKVMFEFTQDWNVQAVSLEKQKPLAIVKQKPEVRKVRNRNKKNNTNNRR